MGKWNNCLGCIHAEERPRSLGCLKRKNSGFMDEVIHGRRVCDKFESTDGYVWSSGCEDYPCCGHSAGECPSGWRRID